MLRSAFRDPRNHTIRLPPGITELRSPLEFASGARDISIVGDPGGSILRMGEDFQGRAAILGINVTGIRVSEFQIVGARKALASDRYLPPSNVAFAAYYDANGLLFADSRSIEIRNVSLTRIKSFPILISRSTGVSIDGVSIEDSGTLNKQGHSNTTGGVLLEEGCAQFSVKSCHIKRICGNGVWTHSNYGSPLNRDGVIDRNEIVGTPRDAIQVGHAVRVKVVNNSGSQIGVPASQVDTPALATPVALDSSGNVEASVYSGNRFSDVDGQCIDLDGFHDGSVVDNSCVNKKALEAYPHLHEGIVFGNSFPEMHAGGVVVRGNVIEGFGYGGIFLIGERNLIIGNRFVDINRNRCTGGPTPPQCNYALEEPGLLRSGIYLSGHAARPAETRMNVIRDNFVSGFGARRWCIGAGPGVQLASNEIGGNECVDLP